MHYFLFPRHDSEPAVAARWSGAPPITRRVAWSSLVSTSMLSRIFLSVHVRLPPSCYLSVWERRFLVRSRNNTSLLSFTAPTHFYFFRWSNQSLTFLPLLPFLPLHHPSFILFFSPLQVKVKTSELRDKKRADLLKQLDDLKAELANLRVAKVTGGAASKLVKIKVVRKSIARVLTVYNQTQRARSKEYLKNRKYLPKDLREKKTRAIRRRLSTHIVANSMLKTKGKGANSMTVRATKKASNFPARRYAVKAL